MISDDSPRGSERVGINRNARLGLLLFLIYCLLYGGFVALTTLAPQRMQQPVAWLAGVNLAVAYGMALIVAAFVLAIIYMMLCSDAPPEGQA